MHPTLRGFTLSILLLLSGVIVVASGVTGVFRDIAATIPARWLPSADGRPPATPWRVRRCLANSPCRKFAGVLFVSSVAGHRWVLCGGMLVVVAAAVWLRHVRLRSWRPRRAGDEARFASRAELRRLTRSPGAWFPLGYARRWPIPYRSRRRAGLVSTLATAWAQPVRLPEKDLARHVLVVGLTGSHKTTSVVFPILLEAAHAGVSVIALDLKYGEADSLARAAAEWRRCAKDVLTFAPLEPASLRWNPIDRCRTMGEAYQFAAELFDEPDRSDRDLMYWLGAERHVCAVLCFALANDAGHPGPATLGRLRSLCESGPEAVESHVRRHPSSQDLVPRLGAYAAMLRKDQAGILQGIAARLEAWGDDAVCAATGPSAPWESIDLSRVRREPLLLVVGVPQGALGRLRWLCHLFLRHLAATLLRPRTVAERTRVLLILEELPVWGALPGLADQLATYRSREVTVLATLQSEAQGEHVYGRNGWAAVSANLLTKLYLPTLGDFDAERLSRVMGVSIGEEVAWSHGWGSAGTRRGEHRRAIPIPLARPEVLRVGNGSDEILVRFATLPPARLWCPPYYLRPEYHDRIPDRPITTADLAVYHHLWTARGRSGPAPSRRWDEAAGQVAGVAGRGPAAVAAGEVAAGTTSGSAATVQRLAQKEISQPILDPGPEPSARPPAQGDVPAPAVPGSVHEVRQLHEIVESLVLRARRDAGRAARAVHHGGRLMEVRVRSDVMLEVCRGAEAMYALARRWSTLRWVRRVRPTFVLSRRALDVLDPRLVAALRDACGPESTPGSSPTGPGRP